VTTTAEELVTQTKDITGGAGIDVVLDTVSDPPLFQKSLNTLNRGGK